MDFLQLTTRQFDLMRALVDVFRLNADEEDYAMLLPPDDQPCSKGELDKLQAALEAIHKRDATIAE
jgi:hypothetical protein